MRYFCTVPCNKITYERLHDHKVKLMGVGSKVCKAKRTTVMLELRLGVFIYNKSCSSENNQFQIFLSFFKTAGHGMRIVRGA